MAKNNNGKDTTPPQDPSQTDNQSDKSNKDKKPKTGIIREIKPNENKKPRIGPVTHELKTDHKYFGPQWTGIKNFDIRKNDRDFQVNDHIWFSEFKRGKATGRRIWTKIIYILDDKKFVSPGYVALSLKILQKLNKHRPI